MKKLTVKTTYDCYSFSIEKEKTIVGEVSDKSDLLNALKSVFDKVPTSEYSKNNDVFNEILIDDANIDIKNYLYFELNGEIDLVNEYKLTSKASLTKVLQTVFKQLEFSDELQTINIVLSELIQNVESTLNEKGLDLYFSNYELNTKSLLDLISVSLQKDEMCVNQNDLTFFEVIKLKKNMIKFLHNENKHVKSIIVVTDEIDYDDLLDIENLMILNFKQKEKYILYNCTTKTDYEDENSLYEMYLSSNHLGDFESYKKTVIEQGSKLI